MDDETLERIVSEARQSDPAAFGKIFDEFVGPICTNRELVALDQIEDLPVGYADARLAPNTAALGRMRAVVLRQATTRAAAEQRRLATDRVTGQRWALRASTRRAAQSRRRRPARRAPAQRPRPRRGQPAHLGARREFVRRSGRRLRYPSRDRKMEDE